MIDRIKELKTRIDRSINLFNAKEYIKEVFWMFYFLPIIASMITAVVIMVLHIDWYFLIPAVLIGGYCLQNLLFFMKYGKRKKKFHAGSE